MKRRTFIRCVGCTAAAASMLEPRLVPEYLRGFENACAFDFTKELSSVEAKYYKKLEGGGIECGICPRHCRVTDLERGYCGTRENRADTYYTLIYGLPCALNIDPIEKKPLYHYYPGTKALSLATAGCNVNCKFCQNWEISQSRPEQTDNLDISPKAMIDIAEKRKVPHIAYTYSEPVIFYEYMSDIARLGHEKGVKSVMITGRTAGRTDAASRCYQGGFEVNPRRLLPRHCRRRIEAGAGCVDSDQGGRHVAGVGLSGRADSQ